MALSVIILICMLCAGLHARELRDIIGVDVLGSLKEQGISCDLHQFVTSTDNSEKEYHALRHDLATYCSKTESIYLSAVLCRMILIELEIGCSLSNKTRPKPVKYSYAYTPAQICSMHKIVHTNKWIWEKLTQREKTRIGSSWVELCPKLTTANSTLRLARFFYKIAPRIRHAEASILAAAATGKPLTDPIMEVANANNSSLESIGSLPKVSRDAPLSPVKNKKYSIFDAGLRRVKFNRTRRNSGQRKHFLDKAEETLLDFANAGREVEEQKKEAGADEGPVKKIDGILPDNDRNRTVQDERRLPRRPVQAEREYINERKRPDNLNMKDVFQPHDRNRPRSLEGEEHLSANSNTSHRRNHGEQRTKLSLHSDMHRHDEDELGDWTNTLTTFFLLLILTIIIIYFLLSNRNKLLALFIEGCSRTGYGRSGTLNSPRRTRLSQPSS